MNIFKLDDNSPFSMDINIPFELKTNKEFRLDNFTMIFINNGKMTIEVDFCLYNVQAYCHLNLFAGQFFKCIQTSQDLNVSYFTFNSNLYFEITSQFSSSFFPFIRQFPLSPNLTKEQIEWDHLMLQIIHRNFMMKDHPFQLQMIKNCIQNILMDLYNNTKSLFLKKNRDKNNPRQEELLEKFIALIYQYDIPKREVQFYAEKLCITARYLSFIIQNMTGMSPKKIIDNHCITEIKRLLRTTNMSLVEITYKLNFPDQSFFTRYFKKHTGTTPSEYRGKND